MDDNEYDVWAVVVSRIDAAREGGGKLSVGWRRMTVDSSIFQRIPVLCCSFWCFSVIEFSRQASRGMPGEGELGCWKVRKTVNWAGGLAIFFQGEGRIGLGCLPTRQAKYLDVGGFGVEGEAVERGGEGVWADN